MKAHPLLLAALLAGALGAPIESLADETRAGQGTAPTAAQASIEGALPARGSAPGWV